jgi:hypothetical protein
MRKLLPLLMLMPLLTSCVKRVPVHVPVEPCKIKPPPGELVYNPQKVGDGVVLSVADAVALAVWIFKAAEYQDAVARCPYVEHE